MKILIAVDGSKFSLDAVDCVVDHADWYREKPEVELVTVHLPVPKLPRMGMAVGKAQIERYYEEEGQQNLAAAKRKLDAAGIRYQARVLVGDIAESIVRQAKSARCERRARCAPRQKCSPTPKARWRFGWRSMRKRSGSLKTDSSRLAEG